MKAGRSLRADSPSVRGFAGGWLTNVRAAFLSVVFPAGCRICEQLLTGATRIPICNDCLGSFRPISGTVCEKWGRPVEGGAGAKVETTVRPTCVDDCCAGHASPR